MQKGKHVSDLLRLASRTRIVEKLLLEAFSDGLVHGTVHTSIGQEYTAEVLARYLVDGDFVFGTHRAHHHFLAAGGSPESLFAEILGKEKGNTRGLGGTQHLHHGNLFSNGIQGGMVPLAFGASSAIASDKISVAVVGDGTFGQGVVYEVLNWAKIFGGAMLLLIEDNRIAQSTPPEQYIGTALISRVEAFGWGVFETSTFDLTKLDDTIRASVEEARSKRSPVAIFVETQRLMAHSKGDDNRPLADRQALVLRDPIEVERKSNEIFDFEYLQLEESLRNLIEEIKLWPPSATHYPTSEESLSSYISDFDSPEWGLNLGGLENPVLIRDWINTELEICLHDSNVMFVGEDIETLPPGMEKSYSGAFGIAKDLSLKFNSQVKNTPISEQAIAGMAIGRALAGKPTIAEFMFADFSTLAVDQIRQQASKIPSMYGEKVCLPVLFRLPVGGRRGYGPTHSQNVEDLFVGTPNIICVSINPFLAQFEGVYRRLLNLPLPTLIFEPKDSYQIKNSPKIPPFYSQVMESDQLGLPVVTLSPKGFSDPIVTLVTFGSAVGMAIEALEDLFLDEIGIELVLCSTIWPWPIEQIARSLSRTGKLLFVEEGLESRSTIGGLISELNKFRGEAAKVFNLGAKSDVGSSRHSEHSALINSEMIAEKVRRIS